MSRKWIVVVLSCVVFSIGYAGEFVSTFFGNKPAFVSSFIVGVFDKDMDGNYNSREIHNILTVGNNQKLETLTFLMLSPGSHDLELLICHSDGKVVKSIKHGVVVADGDGHTHSLYSVWQLDIPNVKELFVVVVDTFGNKRTNINTFKLSVEKES